LIQILVLILVGILAMSALAGLFTLVLILVGVAPNFVQYPQHIVDPYGVEAYSLKVYQLIQAIGLFIIPYVLYRKWMGQSSYSLSLSSTQVRPLVIFAMVVLSSLPLVNYLAEWNASLPFPGSIQDWIEGREQAAEALLELFLRMDTPFDLMVNFLLIAVVTAFAEEFFFRGTLQPIILRLIPNVHVAIWLTAFLFSFFHLQFLGFFPRMLLGSVFGYAAHWTGSLALPIAGHLVNNGVAVLLTYLIGIETLSEEAETLGANEGEWTVALLSGVILLVGMWSVYRQRSAGARQE